MCPGSLFSKIVNLCRTEAGLTSKWGKILPEVYWCHQIQSIYTVGHCVMSRGVAGKLADYTHTHRQYYVLRQHAA